MANKKVFTNLTFEGGAELISPRLNPTSTAPTTLAAGQVYYDSGATTGYLRVAQDDTNFKNILHQSVGQADNYFALDGYFKFDLADGTTPFQVTSTTVVANLNAAQVAGKVPNAAANAGDIPVYGTNGVLKVGTPLADDDASSKGYVDTAVQGLDFKASVKYTGSANIANLTSLTSGNISDFGSGAALSLGDRVLVKNQSTASENGIYTATTTTALALAPDSGYGVELMDNGSFTGTDGDAPSSNITLHSYATAVIDTNRCKLTIVGGQGYGFCQLSWSATVGKAYRVQFKLQNGNATNVKVKPHQGVTITPSEVASTSTSLGSTESVTVVPSSEVFFIRLQVEGSAGEYGFFEDVSIQETELTDGAYVFVEEGTAANESWVLNGSTVWSQFSGAGQLDVTSNGVTSTAPLTKSGDTIDFKYSTDSLSTTADELLLNGTAWTGATGSTKPNSWTLGIAGTYTIDSSSGSGSEPALKIARNGSTNYPYIWQAFAVVTGIKYRVTYRVKNVDATNVKVGLGETAVAEQYNLSTYTSASWADFDETFTATTDLFSIYVQVNTSTGTQSGYIDSVSVVPALDVDALHVQSGGIDTVHLADDAVEPAKLLETGDFIMGGLGIGATPVNDLQIGTHVAAVGTGNHIAFSNGTNAGALFQSNTFTNIYTSNAFKFWVSGAGAATIAASRKVGIGPDVDSPLGQLHVSTARYGSELSPNVNFNSNITGWNNYGAGGLSRETSSPIYSGAGSLKGTITQPSSTTAWYGVTAALTWRAGATYIITAKAYLVAGWDGGSLRVTHGGSLSGSSITFTDLNASTTGEWQDISTRITVGADTTGNLYIYSTAAAGSGKIFYLDDISCKEDIFYNASGTTFGYADDLVINDKDQAGLTILGGTDARVHFGNSSNSSHTQIISSYDGDFDSKLEFQASVAGTANPVMTLYGVDKSVKIEEDGKLGVGMVPSYALDVQRDATAGQGSWAARIENLAVSANPAGLTVRIGQAASTSMIFQLQAGGSTRFGVLGDGSAHFNGGNLAIGGTTADTKLHLQDASDV